MSHGALSMTHSPNGRPLNGRVHCHQDKKKSKGVQVQNQGDGNCFFDVYVEFLPQDQTIYQNLYKKSCNV